jgi:uncharacterized protein YkwD
VLFPQSQACRSPEPEQFESILDEIDEALVIAQAPADKTSAALFGTHQTRAKAGSPPLRWDEDLAQCVQICDDAGVDRSLQHASRWART